MAFGFFHLENSEISDQVLKNEVLVSHVPIRIVKSIILPLKKLSTVMLMNSLPNTPWRKKCLQSSILVGGGKRVVIGNVSDSIPSTAGSLMEGYAEPWTGDGNIIATWGIVDDITINHQPFKYTIDRMRRNFPLEWACNKPLGIVYYHGQNICHRVCGSPRKSQSSVLLSDYHCEEWGVTLLPCVLKDINKLSCKAVEFQQASDQCMDEFQAIIFREISPDQIGKDLQRQFGGSTS